MGPLQRVAGPQAMIEARHHILEGLGVVATRTPDATLDGKRPAGTFEATAMHIAMTRDAIARRAPELSNSLHDFRMARLAKHRVVRTRQRKGGGMLGCTESVRQEVQRVMALGALLRDSIALELPQVHILVAGAAILRLARQEALLPRCALVTTCTGDVGMRRCQRKARSSMQLRRDAAVCEGRIHIDVAIGTPATRSTTASRGQDQI